jgi:hypothetical protein
MVFHGHGLLFNRQRKLAQYRREKLKFLMIFSKIRCMRNIPLAADLADADEQAPSINTVHVEAGAPDSLRASWCRLLLADWPVDYLLNLGICSVAGDDTTAGFADRNPGGRTNAIGIRTSPQRRRRNLLQIFGCYSLGEQLAKPIVTGGQGAEASRLPTRRRLRFSPGFV